MIKFRLVLFACLLLLTATLLALPKKPALRGQLSGWATINPEKRYQTQVGLRYIPEVSLETALSATGSLAIELSANVYRYGIMKQSSRTEFEGDMKPYRFWLRFSTPHLELRAGLQKINFGSATLLRPLMWFDRIDPRDPLQLTDGVYALLGRYYFTNNTNIWIWGLYGNDESKGWEVMPSSDKKPELGGRIQVPLFTGEVAVTYHHRTAELQNTAFAGWYASAGKIPEDRIGVDGKFDIGIGLWFEGVMVQRDIEISQLRYQRMLNLGLDYTFSLGNGLNIIGEYITIATADRAFSSGEGTSFSAASLNYPLGLLDSITAMFYYDWENQNWYRFLNWQRLYDRWRIYLIGFWNPDEFQIYQTQTEGSLFAGKGFQVMLVFNH